MIFRKENVNPKGKKTGDCVIRAISIGLGKDYWQVVDELVEVYKKTGYMINSKEGFNAYLKSNGYEMQKQPRKANGKKFTVSEFAEYHTKGTYILNLANHLTCLKDSELIDLWDCSRKVVGNFWIIE